MCGPIRPRHVQFEYQSGGNFEWLATEAYSIFVLRISDYIRHVYAGTAVSNGNDAMIYYNRKTGLVLYISSFQIFLILCFHWMFSSVTYAECSFVEEQDPIVDASKNYKKWFSYLQKKKKKSSTIIFSASNGKNIVNLFLLGFEDIVYNSYFYLGK